MRETKKDIEVTAFDLGQYQGDWPPANAKDFLAWFSAKIEAEVPPDYQDTVEILIDVPEYDKDPRIKISYFRPETDAETAHQLQQEQYGKERKKHQELGMLAKLKTKYEGQP